MIRKIVGILSFLIYCLIGGYLFGQEFLEVPKASSDSSFLLDAQKTASFWSRSVVLPKLSIEDATNELFDQDTRIELTESSEWLFIGLTIKENKNVIAVEYMNNQPLWYDDNVTFSFQAGKKTTVQINPLGTINVSQEGIKDLELLKQNKIRACTRIYDDYYRSEIAVHKSLLLTKEKYINLVITREKQARGYIPFTEAKLKVNIFLTPIQIDDKPIFVLPRQAYANLTLVSINTLKTVPETMQDWQNVSSQNLILSTGDNTSDPNFQPTEVKIGITEDKFCIRIENFESDMANFSKDEELLKIDSNTVILTPDGYRYIDINFDAKNNVTSHYGKTGGRRVIALQTPEWVKSKIEFTDKSWVVYYYAPIQEIMDFAGAPKAYTPDYFSWQIQIIRNRANRIQLNHKAQESMLALTNSGTTHCPTRFAKMTLNKETLIKNIHERVIVPPTVFSSTEAIENKLSIALDSWFNDKVKELDDKNHKTRDSISSLVDWEKYKSYILKQMTIALYPNENGKLPARIDTKATEVFSFEENGVIVKGLMLRSRKNMPITATLYLPQKSSGNHPVIIMLPSHHSTRNTPNIFDLAKNLVDNNCIAIAIDAFGSGERVVASRWNHVNHQRNLVGSQLILVNETMLGGAVADVLSTVDYLYERKDVDRSRIGLIGGVAGGGDIVGPAGALDDRISLVIPFNHNYENTYFSWYDLTRSFPYSYPDSISPLLVDALIAPRYYIYAAEFEWTEQLERNLQYLKKIFSYYQSEDKLSFLYGKAKLDANTAFREIHRIEVYKSLNKWWGLNLPVTVETEKHLKLDINKLETGNYQMAKKFVDRYYSRKTQDIDHISSYNEPNYIAKNFSNQGPKAKVRKLEELEKILKTIFPNTKAYNDEQTNRNLKLEDKPLQNVKIALEAKSSDTSRLFSCVWLLKPNIKHEKYPLVLCLSQESKAIFYNKRYAEINEFLQAGYVVALADVRGVGETELTNFRWPEFRTADLSYNIWQMKDSLLGLRIKDTNTILNALLVIPELDKDNITIWGEGFTEPNGKENEIFKFEELPFRQAGPSGKHYLEPLGPLLAIFSTYFLSKEITVKNIICRSSLVSYQSILEDFYFYLPADILVPNILNKTDLPEVVEHLVQKNIKVFMEDMRDAKNRILSERTARMAYPHVTVLHEQISSSLISNILK